MAEKIPVEKIERIVLEAINNKTVTTDTAVHMLSKADSLAVAELIMEVEEKLREDEEIPLSSQSFTDLMLEEFEANDATVGSVIRGLHGKLAALAEKKD